MSQLSVLVHTSCISVSPEVWLIQTTLYFSVSRCLTYPDYTVFQCPQRYDLSRLRCISVSPEVWLIQTTLYFSVPRGLTYPDYTVFQCPQRSDLSRLHCIHCATQTTVLRHGVTNHPEYRSRGSFVLLIPEPGLHGGQPKVSHLHLVAVVKKYIWNSVKVDTSKIQLGMDTSWRIHVSTSVSTLTNVCTYVHTYMCVYVCTLIHET